MRELPFVDGNRVAALAWSYGGESLAAFESAPKVPYVIFHKNEAPFEKWTHGDFNFIEGAKPRYESVATEVKKALDRHLGAAAADPKPIEIESDDLLVTADFHRAQKERGCIALFHQSGSSRGEHRSIGPALAAQGFTAVSADLRWGRRDRWNGVWNETARRAGTIEVVDRGEREKFEAIRHDQRSVAVLPQPRMACVARLAGYELLSPPSVVRGKLSQRVPPTAVAKGVAMACGTLVVWDPVPGDCIFRLRAAGDGNVFNAFASVSVNGRPRPSLRHEDIVPGPATIEIAGADRFWVIKPLLMLTTDPEEPVTMEAWLENTDGSTVQIPDGAGGTIEARCDWSIDEDAMSPLAIRISVTS